jgi:hypothetical protein
MLGVRSRVCERRQERNCGRHWIVGDGSFSPVRAWPGTSRGLRPTMDGAAMGAQTPGPPPSHRVAEQRVRAGITPRSLIWSQRRSHKGGTPDVPEGGQDHGKGRDGRVDWRRRPINASTSPHAFPSCHGEPESSEKGCSRRRAKKHSSRCERGSGTSSDGLFLLRLAAD